MKKKKMLKLLIVYVIAHLVFMPTYEVGKGFTEIEKQIDGVTISARLTGAYSETHSRILNIANEEGPYYIQTAIKISDNQFDGAAFESIALIDLKTMSEIVLLATPQPIEKFSKYSGMPSIVGFSSEYNLKTQQGSIYLNNNDYVIKMKIRACKGQKCRWFEFEEPLKYRIKRKFYSNSFANMMGI